MARKLKIIAKEEVGFPQQCFPMAVGCLFVQTRECRMKKYNVMDCSTSVVRLCRRSRAAAASRCLVIGTILSKVIRQL